MRSWWVLLYLIYMVNFETENGVQKMDANTRQYRLGDKNCCCCEYWTGVRKIDINQKIVTAVPRDKGKCFGERKPIEKMAQDKMPCCRTWLLLKENSKSEALHALQDLIVEIKTSDDSPMNF